MPAKILLIDDDTYIREFYQELLTNNGYEVDTARNGKEGLEKIQQGGYHLIILDVIMPLIDGIGILEKLKEDPPKQKNGAIVIFTNLANDPAVKEALKNGAQKALIKSEIKPDVFLAEIKALIS